MHIILGIVLLLHGVAHLVGFVVPWGFGNLPDTAYTTTLLAGRVDIGHTGIRIVGVLWLVTALAFAAAGVGTLMLQPWWRWLTLTVASVSLVLSLLGWPEARIGVLVDLAILSLVLLGPRAA